MVLSGGIQVWADQRGIAMDQRRALLRGVVEVYRQVFYTPYGAVNAFEAEVLRIKEAPHGTDAE